MSRAGRAGRGKGIERVLPSSWSRTEERSAQLARSLEQGQVDQEPRMVDRRSLGNLPREPFRIAVSRQRASNRRSVAAARVLAGEERADITSQRRRVVRLVTPVEEAAG